MKNSNQPIYPLQHEGFPSREFVIEEGTIVGLTKREYFAAMAMQGLLANPNIKRPEQNSNLKNDLKIFSSIAIEYADAILSELS